MITHEEARKYAHNIITEDTTMKHHRPARELYEYANQQEAQEQRLKKTEELVELYKNLLPLSLSIQRIENYFSEYSPYEEGEEELNQLKITKTAVERKIAKLEKELEELK